jgi:hypothetical protein
MGKKSQGGALDVAGGVILAKLGLWLAGKLGKGVRRLAFRWRRALSPVFFGFVVWLVSVIARALVPQWWAVALVLPVFGIAVAWFGPKLGDRWSAFVMRLVPTGLDSGVSGVMDRPIERIYFGSLVSLIGVYMAVRIGAGPSDFTGWFWKIGLLLYGGSWWYHRRVRTAGRADRYARKFVKFADRDRCPDTLRPFIGCKVTAVKGKGRVAMLTVRLAEGMTVDVVSRLTKPLASAFSMRPASVFIKEDPTNARSVVITFLPSDPWKGKIDHPMPEPGTISLKSVAKRFAMGLYADGRELLYDLQHTLVVGQTGSGKSIWLHSLMTWLTACSDTIIVAIDMAGGATLGVWRKCLALPLADDLASAIVILEAVFNVIKDRERALGKASEEDDDAADSFEPSAKTPWLILVIDEFPDLLAEAKATSRGDNQGTYEKVINNLLMRIGKKARKCGVRLIFASQNGTKPDLGSKELQAQLRAVVGLALDAQQSRNLWQSLERLGWNSTHLREGQFLLRDDYHTVPDAAKGFFVSNQARRRHVMAAYELHKTLEPSAWQALCGLDATLVMPVETVEPVEPVLDHLREQGPAKVDTLVDRIGEISRATVYRRLKAYAEQGLVVNRNGTWRLRKDSDVDESAQVDEGPDASADAA